MLGLAKKVSKIELLGCVGRITRRVGWEEMVRSEEGVEEKEMAKVREPRGRGWWAREMHTCRLKRKDRKRILGFLVIVKTNNYPTLCNKGF